VVLNVHHTYNHSTCCYPVAHHGHWVRNSEGGRHLTQMCPVSSHVLLFSLQTYDCYSEAPEFNAQSRQCTDFSFDVVILACLPKVKLRIWRLWGFLPEPMLSHCSPLPPITLLALTPPYSCLHVTNELNAHTQVAVAGQGSRPYLEALDKQQIVSTYVCGVSSCTYIKC